MPEQLKQPEAAKANRYEEIMESLDGPGLDRIGQAVRLTPTANQEIQAQIENKAAAASFAEVEEARAAHRARMLDRADLSPFWTSRPRGMR